MYLKMLSACVVCCIYLLTLLTNVSMGTNRVMDPDQTAPAGAKLFQQMTKADDFCCEWRIK